MDVLVDLPVAPTRSSNRLRYSDSLQAHLGFRDLRCRRNQPTSSLSTSHLASHPHPPCTLLVSLKGCRLGRLPASARYPSHQQVTNSFTCILSVLSSSPPSSVYDSRLTTLTAAHHRFRLLRNIRTSWTNAEANPICLPKFFFFYLFFPSKLPSLPCPAPCPSLSIPTYPPDSADVGGCEEYSGELHTHIDSHAESVTLHSNLLISANYRPIRPPTLLQPPSPRQRPADCRKLHFAIPSSPRPPYSPSFILGHRAHQNIITVLLDSGRSHQLTPATTAIQTEPFT
ncbi:hypothetical protein F4778DRAFT_446540 [Xylariomycetidae sp. FL2044]|nr:hypothetical protein F4778DRAFT_446540 [Xylariomycetidae sp. FL2044]